MRLWLIGISAFACSSLLAFGAIHFHGNAIATICLVLSFPGAIPGLVLYGGEAGDGNVTVVMAAVIATNTLVYFFIFRAVSKRWLRDQRP